MPEPVNDAVENGTGVGKKRLLTGGQQVASHIYGQRGAKAANDVVETETSASDTEIENKGLAT